MGTEMVELVALEDGVVPVDSGSARVVLLSGTVGGGSIGD